MKSDAEKEKATHGVAFQVWKLLGFRVSLPMLRSLVIFARINW